MCIWSIWQIMSHFNMALTNQTYTSLTLVKKWGKPVRDDVPALLRRLDAVVSVQPRFLSIFTQNVFYFESPLQNQDIVPCWLPLSKHLQLCWCETRGSTDRNWAQVSAGTAWFLLIPQTNSRWSTECYSFYFNIRFLLKKIIQWHLWRNMRAELQTGINQTSILTYTCFTKTSR